MTKPTKKMQRLFHQQNELAQNNTNKNNLYSLWFFLIENV